MAGPVARVVGVNDRDGAKAGSAVAVVLLKLQMSNPISLSTLSNLETPLTPLLLFFPCLSTFCKPRHFLA